MSAGGLPCASIFENRANIEAELGGASFAVPSDFINNWISVHLLLLWTANTH